MLEALWLVPALPFAGFTVLALLGGRLGKRGVAIVGVGSIALSLAACLLVASGFQGAAYRQELWPWMEAGRFRSAIAFHLDALSLVMSLVVTFVGTLIHLYSTEYMAEEEGYSRFFAYMNLFVGAMLTLLLADDLVLLYLGWEGVGLCSYLLIGFWYVNPANGRAAQKAFIVTRVGDVAMAVALFLLFANLGTVRIDEIVKNAGVLGAVGSTLPVAIAALLLGGAVGKSAQLPLQTWLPDAMAGPTPVSALIHAATMVTAGVYLIARMHTVFALAPPVMTAVAVVGAVTLLLAGFSAWVQRDLKRILAYSTIAQIGYMFLALGVGAWSAAIFHFMTHAFFKALLFLTAGVVILALHHEQDVFKMGGLRRELPVAFWAFLIGAASLAGLPVITAGFYSKDLILWDGLASPMGSPALLAAGWAGSLLTGLYAFRAVFKVFFGKKGTPVTHPPGLAMGIPVGILAVLSLVGGFVQRPHGLLPTNRFVDFMSSTLPPLRIRPEAEHWETAVALGSAGVALVGVLLAYFLHYGNRGFVTRWSASPTGSAVNRFLAGGWGFDRAYDLLFVRPYAWLARADREDVVDYLYRGIAALVTALHRAVRVSVSGVLRWYAASVALGAALLIALAVFT